MKGKMGIGRTFLFLVVISFGILQLCRSIERYIRIEQADVFVRVSFTGLENLFHDRYEYYAIDSKQSYKVSEREAEKKIGKGVEGRSRYDDKGTFYCYVDVIKSIRGSYVYEGEGPYLKTTLGDQYGIAYIPDRYGGDERPLNSKDLGVIAQVVEAMIPEEEKNDAKYSYIEYSDSFSLFDFVLIEHNEKYLIKYNEKYLLRINENGNITKVMEVPSRGMFDFYYFCDTE